MRIMLVYPDGKATYANYYDDGEEPVFELGKQTYSVEDIKATGAIIATNTTTLLHRFTELGITARPTSKQFTITVSVREDTKLRMHMASKAKGRSVSNIIEELATKWLDENGY